MKYFYSICIIIISLFIATSCKKEIKLPDTSLEKLYGKWNLVKSYGKHGEGEIPSAGGYQIWISFNNLGEYDKYRDSIQLVNGMYRVDQEVDSLSENYILTTTASYRYNGKEYNLGDSLRIDFKGDDTLALYCDCENGLDYLYTRIK
jgi:hypothetical protein